MKKMLIKSLCFSLKCLFLAGAFLLLNFDSYADNNAKQSETTVQQQQKVIKGTVLDENKKPLPGVSVAVKGQTRGTATDINGRFEIKVKKGDVLIISFVGMESKEVTIADQKELTVTLEEKRQRVAEVVVTALGIKRDAKAVGYSAVTVGNEEITAVQKTDVISSLSGKVAGVQISTNADPGASSSIMIRGISSLGGNNQPLYVVDGVPLNNSVVSSADALNEYYDYGSGANLINPDDVESVTILKGAAATALYGSRAANGVVLVTTKSGMSKKKGLGITFSTSYEVSDFLKLPEMQNEFGMGWDGHTTLNENGSWGPRFDGTIRPWGNVYNNSQKIKPYVAKKDNVKEFFDYGMKVKNSISFNGGNEVTNFYASYSNVHDDGMIPYDSDLYNKNTFSLRGQHKFDKLTLSASVNLGEQKNKFCTTGQGNSMINSLYQIPRDISIISLENTDDPFNTQDYYFTPYGVINPYLAIKNNMNTFRQEKIYGKVQADYKFSDNLNLTYRFGYDATNNEQKRGLKELRPAPGTPNSGIVGNIATPGSVSKSMIRRREINQDIFFDYGNSFNDFTLNVVGGININERTYSSIAAGVTGLDIVDFFDLSNSAATPNVDEYYSKRRLVGVYGNVELAYREMLFLTMTARNDWSSTLPEDNRSFFYPGTTLSFVFTELMNDSWKDILSFGKLRLAYGQTGNDANVYMINPYYVSGAISNPFGDILFPLGGINGFEYGNTLGNLNLSPEITSEYEIGFNIALFNGRINLDAAYYNKTSDKQIFALGMDPATGFTSQNTNLGELENKGIEALVSVIPIKTKEFSWNVSFNYTRNRSEVLSLPEELGSEVDLYGFGAASSSTHMVARVGGPVGEFKVTMPKTTPDGKIIVNPENGQPIAGDNLQYAGDMESDYELGISNKFTYKDFSLSFDFDIREGGLMYSRTKDINYFVGNAPQTTYNDRQPFIIPNSVVEVSDGVYKENITPIINTSMVDYFSGGMDRLNREFLIDRSYIKLRNISLAYNLPKKWASKIKMQGIKASIYATNVFLWTKEQNCFIDPESTSFGNDLLSKFGEYTTNPSTRRIGFNLQLTF